MRVHVKLFSVLRDYVAGYDPQQGLEAELPDGATMADLIRHLGIPPAKAPVVTCNGRVLKADDVLENGSALHIFQPVAGG